MNIQPSNFMASQRYAIAPQKNEPARQQAAPSSTSSTNVQGDSSSTMVKGLGFSKNMPASVSEIYDNPKNIELLLAGFNDPSKNDGLRYVKGQGGFTVPIKVEKDENGGPIYRPLKQNGEANQDLRAVRLGSDDNFTIIKNEDYKPEISLRTLGPESDTSSVQNPDASLQKTQDFLTSENFNKLDPRLQRLLEIKLGTSDFTKLSDEQLKLAHSILLATGKL